MKTFIKTSLILMLVLSISYCANKKRSPMLLALGQTIQQESAASPTEPTPSQTLQTETSLTTSTSSNDSPPPPALPNVSFALSSSSQYRDYYSDTTHEVTLNLSSASTSEVTVNISTSGDAVSGTHFVLPSSSVTFNPNETSKPLNVTVKKEDCIDYAQPYTLILTLTSPTNANLGTTTSHTITIMRNAGCE